MAENIGSLIVEITTSAEKLNAGLKDAEAKVQATAGKISEFTNKIALGMTVAGAAITAVYAAMVKSSVEYGEQIYTVSQRTGIAVNTLSKLQYVADQTESSFEAVAMGMKFLNRNIYEATNGNLKANESFRTLGITLKDEVTGEVLKAEDVFFKMADVFKGIDDAATKTALAMQVFGRGGEALIPMLNLGSAEIQRLSQEAERLGLVLSTDNAKAINEFSNGMKDLKGAMGGLWLEISRALIPVLKDLAKKATDFIVKLREWSEAYPRLTKFIAELGLALGALMLVLGPLIFMFNQFAQALIFLNFWLPGITVKISALGSALLFLATNPIGIIITTVGLLAAAWIFNWGKIRDKTNSVLDEIAAGMDKLTEKQKALIQILAPALLLPKKKEESLGGGGETRGSGAGGGFGEESVSGSTLDATINKVADHAQKLKELNEAYLIGKINAEQYYTAVLQLHTDGLDIKQAELDLLQNSIDLEQLATDAEYQKIYVMQQGIQSVQEYYRTKAELENQDMMNQQITLDAVTNLFQTLQNMHKTIWQGIFDFINMGIQKFSSGFSTALTSIILGTKKASEAFKDFGMMMIEAIVNFVVEWGVQALLAKTLGTLLTGWVVAEANVLAAAWLPAAILASIATMGGADAAGSAGLAGAMGSGIALFSGMKAASVAAAVPMAEGGIITKPILALMGESGPEAVVPLNKGGFGAGGVGTTINLGGIHIESPIIKNDMDIEELAEQLGDNIRRKLRRVS